ncbi:MAG: hypothetical protein Q4D37_09285 [Oscillospiraceae bacterium]|nr:hypothetical protein [Oscillospiraceae bacterium]
MWICTQNEDALYHVIGVRAIRMISESSYSVIGILPSEKDPVILGEYDDYQTADAEIKHIDAFLSAGTKTVYHMQKQN